MNIADQITYVLELSVGAALFLFLIGVAWETIDLLWKNEYYRWHFVQKYFLFWRKCPECAHPNWWHSWSVDKQYCNNRNDKHCSCGYHIDR